MDKITSNYKPGRNATYVFWSKSAVLSTRMLRMWPEPVRRHYALTLLAVGTLLSECPPRPWRRPVGTI